MWALTGLAFVAVPGTVVEGVLDQPDVGDTAWLRVLGVASIVLAAQMVLVARKLEELWWWSWSFAILELGVAMVLLVHAAVSMPESASTWPWWVGGAVSAGFAAIGVVALAKAGTERSPV